MYVYMYICRYIYEDRYMYIVYLLLLYKHNSNYIYDNYHHFSLELKSRCMSLGRRGCTSVKVGGGREIITDEPPNPK